MFDNPSILRYNEEAESLGAGFLKQLAREGIQLQAVTEKDQWQRGASEEVIKMICTTTDHLVEEKR